MDMAPVLANLATVVEIVDSLADGGRSDTLGLNKLQRSFALLAGPAVAPETWGTAAAAPYAPLGAWDRLQGPRATSCPVPGSE